MNLVCFTEEQSAKVMLDIVLPKILPKNCTSSPAINFEGKSDLDKQIERKLTHYNTPNTIFLILRDQDSAICTEVKQQLLDKVDRSGKAAMSIIRIACHELENFYLGDLSAVAQVFGHGVPQNQNSKKFRMADNLATAKQELIKITNKKYQPVLGSRAIAPHLNLDGSNTSASFNILLSGVKKLCVTQP
ncbi:hypothetical protein SPONL_185 [uncultured Candidatus Thioglobus sp.]|nr:hypothetical protein SPONL_185 [uncultured Candidatus Thioglobus sp.]